MTTDSSEPEGGAVVVLGLGSNRGDGRAIIKGAFALLARRLEAPRLSCLYATSPMYVTDQPPFLNAAVSGVFAGTPRDLLALAQETEAAFGRDRSREVRRGARTLDVDILLFGGLVVEEGPELVIPHPLLAERKFALVPLLELLPEALDPRTGRSLFDSLAVLPPQGIYYADLAPYTS
jgi:2-amino-4-hydroxy-6-hydroxymethyldihydropteridine diphosphokinase